MTSIVGRHSTAGRHRHGAGEHAVATLHSAGHNEAA